MVAGLCLSYTDQLVEFFAIAGITALTIALLTVSFQAIKAALTNPVKNFELNGRGSTEVGGMKYDIGLPTSDLQLPLYDFAHPLFVIVHY